MSDASDASDLTGSELPRRDFLRLAGLGTGAILSGVAAAPVAAAPIDAQRHRQCASRALPPAT
jgi:hypothetical protein